MKLNTLSTALTAACMAFLVPMALIASTPAAASPPTSFAGSWEADGGEETPMGPDKFRLDLVVKDGHICGTHFATMYGQQVGSAYGGVSVTGIVKGSAGIITIDDHQHIYHGTIAFHGAELRWTLKSVEDDPYRVFAAQEAVWPSADMDKAYDRPDFLDEAKHLCGEGPAK